MKTTIEIEKEFDEKFVQLRGLVFGKFYENGEMNEKLKSHISSLRKNDIESLIKEVQNWLTQWRRDFANRPLEDRKDAFAECYIIEIALSSHLSEELKNLIK